MLKFILKRIGYMIVTLWVIITITFGLMHTIPGDPLSSLARELPPEIKANYYAKYGLNKSVPEQYALYLKNLVKGDLGQSLTNPGRDVKDTIKQQIPVTAQIGLQAIAFGFVVGVVLGIIAAFNRNKKPDFIVIFIALLGVSIPSFVVAALLQYSLTVKVTLFPTTGWGGFKYSILPALALSFGSIATYARYMRTSCLEVIGQDYILTAKAKGVSRFNLVWKHIVRNAILPAITILGPQIAGIMVGSFVIETIFSIPGLGSNFVTSITNRDFSMIMGMTVFYAALYIVALLVVDILYALVDPRIRLDGEKR